MVRKSVGRKHAKQDGASVAVPRSDKSKSCLFCNSTIDDEVLYGNIYTIGAITCHYFCVLLSSCMVQSGSDEEGLFGFLEHDMLTELKRGKKLKCCYCKQNGATLACCASVCRKQFHLNCGRKNGVTSLFFGNFQSFCHKHTTTQVLPDELQHRVDVRMRCLQRKQNSESKMANPKVSGEQQGGANVDALAADISNASLSCEEQNQNGRANGTEITARHSMDRLRGDPRRFEKTENPERRLPIRSCKNSTPTTQMKTKDTGGKKAPSVLETQTDISHHGMECECTAHTCPMCYESVQAYPGIESLWPPCCATDVWLHRYCVQHMALNAGMHYLKCPLCNDREIFGSMVKKQGIYVPDRDAAWELETGAFAELQERHALCDATECQCPRGRSYNTQKGSWQLMLCTCCGSQGCHSQCLPSPSQLFVCTDCKVVAPGEINAAEQVSPSTSSERDGQRPVMPSRMSLARTKQKSPRSSGFSNEVILNVSPLKMNNDSQESESDIEIEILEVDSNEVVEDEEQRLSIELAGRHVPELAKLMERVKPGPKSAKMRILEKLIQEHESARLKNTQSVERPLQNSDASNSESPATKIDSSITSINDVVIEQKNEHNLLRNLSADLTQNCTLSISAQSEKSDDIHIAVLELDQDKNFVGYVSKKVNLTPSEHQNCNTEIQNSSEAENQKKSFAEWLTKSEDTILDKNHSTPKTGPENKLSDVESALDLTNDKPVLMNSEKFEYYYLSEVDPTSKKRKESALETKTENSKISLAMNISEMVSKIEDSSQDSSSESEVEIYENVCGFDSGHDNAEIEYGEESKILVSNEEICIDIDSTECILDSSSENSVNDSEEIRAESNDTERNENTVKIESDMNNSTVEKEFILNTEVYIASSQKEVANIKILGINPKNESQIEKISQSLFTENVEHVISKEYMMNTIEKNDVDCRITEEESRNKISVTENNKEEIVDEIESNYTEKDKEIKREVHESYLQDISSDSEIEVVIKKRSVSPVVKRRSDSDVDIRTELIESDEDVTFHSRKKPEAQNLSNSSKTVDSEDHLIDEIISKELAKRSKTFILQSKFRQGMTEKRRRTRSHSDFNSDTEDEAGTVKSRTKYPRTCNTRWNMKISTYQDKIRLKINNRNENMDFVYEKESSQEDNFGRSIDRNQRHSSRRSLMRSNVKTYRCQNTRNRRRVHSLANEKDTWSSKRRAASNEDRSFEDYSQMCQNRETPKSYCRRSNDWSSERPPRKQYERYKNHWSKSRESSQDHISERSYRKDSRPNKECGNSAVNSQGWLESEEKYKSHVKKKNLDFYSSQVSTSRHLTENQSWKQKKGEEELNEVWSSMPYRQYVKLLKTNCDSKPLENSSTRKRHNRTPRQNGELKRIKIDNHTKSKLPDTNFRAVYRQSILDISPESGRPEDMIVRTKEDVLMTPNLKRRKKIVMKRGEDGKKQTDIMRFFHRL